MSCVKIYYTPGPFVNLLFASCSRKHRIFLGVSRYTFICLFVSRIALQVTGWFGWNFQWMLDVAWLRGG